MAIPPNKVPVGLLLPLSGQHARTGQAMLHAAQLALFDMGEPDFTLVPIDTGSTPDGAAAAAQKATARGARLILGPLLADSVRAATPAAREAGIPIVAFSHNRTVAGTRVFLLGAPPPTHVQAN